MKRALLHGLAAIIGILGGIQMARAVPVTISPAVLWPDGAGTHINAHCGDIIKVADKYYWFGEFRNGRRVQNISCYVSTDLSHWIFRKNVITPQTDPEVAQSHLERPKVVYNSKTKKFVMWLHRESTNGYASAECAVADCDTVDGDYVWHGHFRPGGNTSRDSTLYEDDDGTAYFLSSTKGNADLAMYRLTPDYLKVESQVANLFPGQYREAPCVFKRNGIYYLITSFCTGTFPNTQYYSMASKMAGPWGPYHRLAANDTWNTYYSQAAFVLPVQGTQTTSYLYCADRWQVTPMRHIWLPMEFLADGNIAPMHWADSWTLDAETGLATRPEPSAFVVNDLARNMNVSSDYSHKGAMDQKNYSHMAGAQPTDGNDGDATTFWCTNDNLPGHWWKVDLGEASDIAGTQITWHRKNHAYLYRIETSADDVHWTSAADHTSQPNPLNDGTDAFQAANARYVRVTITGIPSGYDWPSFNEFKVLSGGKDIAMGKSASADSWQTNTDCAKAVDGDVSTAWTTDDKKSGHWLDVDLGKPSDVSGSRIMWEAPGFSYQYKIETSVDEKNWVMAMDQTKNIDVVRVVTDRFSATGVRYLRLTVTGFEQGCWPGVREFQILPAMKTEAAGSVKSPPLQLGSGR
jgi:hypothetical protein